MMSLSFLISVYGPSCETLMEAGDGSVFVYLGAGRNEQACGQQKMKGKMGSHVSCPVNNVTNYRLHLSL